MTAIDLHGFVAATLSTASFLPQVIRIWRLRTAEGVSLITFSVLAAGVTLWMIYGIARHDMAIIIANGITLLLTLAVVGLTLHFRHGRASKSMRRPE